MELTIYNTYVVMESQEQCDRMKQLCIDNNLPIWDDERSFEFFRKEKINAFSFDKDDDDFYISSPYNCNDYFKENKITQVTEQEFINLLNKHNETTKTK